MACWNMRGCDDEMQSRCPHNLGNDYCPGDCKFAACDRPTHKVAVGWDLLLNPEVDRSAAVKEVCRTCMFFIEHGPVINRNAE
ncbi:hypothetical protein [Slackia heliotrinireducens]|uniref:Uncharacterized protein n=1 Tax=Slackia heliotrinireducens (strain ATCC 29202 / DSM 20476 / NCTC 11029 / RHS 1) TaxID=471855 RepID=C7N6J7_SLAHD|nr:hypothetical protein [Slackia heliotrinireducens]ACV22532.1 hypothetical protein Shel_15120 [Slackia heliotrinireducens DSM 20476]VEH00979.1 Uncharacterised protein [Slackia heliotrinireducens]